MTAKSAVKRLWPQVAALTPELRALIACARAVLERERLGELQTALKECPSVDRLCETALAQGMLGHLQGLMTGEGAAVFAPVLVERLTGLQRISTLRNLRQIARLLHLLDELQVAGIVAMPYKGPVWAEVLYGDIALRTWADLDLIVGHDDVAAARQVLLADGLSDTSRFNERIMRRRRGSLGQIALGSPDTSTYVELHWEVTAGVGARSLEAESLLARATSVDLLGCQVPCPATTDLFLITCLEGTRDCWNVVERLLGLAVQICRMDSSDWDSLLEAVGVVGCRRRVSVAVRYACRVFALEIEEEVAKSLLDDRRTRALVRSLRLGDSLGTSASNRRKELAGKLWIIRSEYGGLASMRHAAKRLFQPGPADWHALALPAVLGWLYYLFRPLRLAATWSKRLARATRRRSIDRVIE
jgi:hypothetical protein